VDTIVRIVRRQHVHDRPERRPVLQQGGDVLEEDPFRREIFDVADLRAERGDVHGRRHGTAISSTKSPCDRALSAARCSVSGPWCRGLTPAFTSIAVFPISYGFGTSIGYHVVMERRFKPPCAS